MQNHSRSNGSTRSRPCGTNWLFSLLLMFSLVGLLATAAQAQVYTGSITGVVSDPTGAVIPGAKVAVTDTLKGTTVNVNTDAVGRYTVTNLAPSTYKLTIEAAGFKSYLQSGIVLDVNQKAALDVTMQLGQAAQSVEVVGAAPVLSTQDAVTGQEINRTFVNDLPLMNRAVFDLAMLAPGVSQAPGGTFGYSQGANNFVSNGGRNATAEVLIDGVTATTAEPNTAINTVLYTPSVDAVQEFKVQQNNYSAEEGFTGNTFVNMVLRSGTNQFHGSAYEFLRNDKLDSNDWFNNRAGGKLAPLRRNQFGATFGGPIRRDKTFFFVDYEGTREHSMSTHSAGVPDAAMKQGDFSELCGRKGGTYNAAGLCSVADGVIWDPYSGFYDPNGPAYGRHLQTFIPFNRLDLYTSPGNPGLNGTPFQLASFPGNLLDPVALKMIQYYPAPNVNVGTASYDPYNNWTGSGINANSNDQFDIRLDHRFTDATTLYGRFSYGTNTYHGANCFNNPLDPCTQGPGAGGARSMVLTLNHTFSPTTLLNLSLGFTRGYTFTQGVAKDFPSFDPITTLGLPPYMATAGTVASPVIYIYGGYRQASGEALGAQAWSVYKNGSNVYHLMATLTKMVGRHEIKFGGEWRANQMNWYQVGVPGGVFIFDKNATAETLGTGIGGDAMAAFLTGVGSPWTWGEYEIATHLSTQNYRYGGFTQDNWRVTDKLTVGLGLRYDLEIPRTERHNRMNWLDTTAVSPAQVPPLDQVPGFTAAWPSILPTPNLTNIMGGLQFAGVGGNPRRTADIDWNNLGPRFNLAYRLKPKLVLRSGYGLFYNPTEFGTAGAGPGGTDGFAAITNWNITKDGDGVTPWGRVSDPFPTGVILPYGSSRGLSSQLGQSTTAPIRYWNATPYVQTWSAGFQYELPSQVLIDANYIGTKGTKLYFGGGGDLNYLGTWVENPTTALQSALSKQVPNPFYGIITDPTSGMSGPTIGASQLLRPYPQFSGFNSYPPPWANSSYHAFQLRVEKRMSSGLQFLATYTNAKSIDDASLSTFTEWLGGFSKNSDPNNRNLMRSLSEWDLSQIFQLAYVYQLPFGRGKKWGTSWHPVLDAFLGGWQTNGIWRFDTGQPVSLGLNGGSSPSTYGSQQPNITGTLEVNPKSLWFTQGYFANADQVLSVPPANTLGTAPRMLPNTRLPGTNTASLSLFKEISLNKMREGSRLEFRAETFNAFNHPQFGCINATVNTDNIGAVQCQANSPREVQLALKLYF